MKKIGFAVVGLNMGREHVKTILNNKRASLVAVCDLDESRFPLTRTVIKESGQDASTVVFTREFDDILSMKEVDAVVVVTPPSSHVVVSVKAMDAGKHVLCEKPLCHTMESADRMCKYMKKTDRVFQVAYCVRSSLFTKKCLEIIKNGIIGDVVTVWWNMFVLSHSAGWRDTRSLVGGKLFDCGCHYFDILTLWAGAPVERVFGFGTPKGKTGSNPDLLPEVASVIMEFENGVKGSFNLSQVSAVTRQSSTAGIAGTNGKIEAEPFYPEEAGSLTVQAEGGLYTQTYVFHGDRNSRGHLGFDEQYDVFIDAIFKKTPVACTAAEGREIVRLMGAIDRSIATDKPVRLKDIK